MLKRVSDVKSAGPEDNMTGCRAFLIQDTYNDEVNVKIMIYIFLLHRKCPYTNVMIILNYIYLAITKNSIPYQTLFDFGTLKSMAAFYVR